MSTSAPSVPESTPDPSSAALVSGRVDWVDSAKGLAILLVVFFHVGRILFQADVIGGTWLEVNRYVALLRMPLFFALSGLFLGSVLTRSWASLWRSRLSILIWAFGVWVLLRFGFFTLFPLDSRPSENDLSRLLEAPWQPLNGLWFLHALALYTVAARATRAVPAGVQLAVAAALSWATLWQYATPETYPQRLGAYYFFFIAACHLSRPLRSFVERCRPTTTLGLVACFLVGAWAVVALDVEQLLFPLGVVAVVAGATVAARLPSRLASSLAWLGERTLPVYVGHFIVIGATCEVLLALDITVRGTIHAGWLVPALVVWATTVALLAWTGLMRTPLAVLYRPPAWFQGAGRRQER